MPNDPEQRDRAGEPEYRVYRGGGGRGRAATPAGRAARGGAGDGAPSRGGGGGSGRGGGGLPYTTYRSQPRGLIARLRGQSDAEVASRHEYLGGDGARSQQRSLRRGWTWRRALKYLVLAVVAWLALSFVLFMVSSYTHGNLPASATNALTSGSNMLTGSDTVLILGTDQRPRVGAGSKEPGSVYTAAGSRSDTMMVWQIGGGVSRRVSIPRDTIASIPGHGVSKINAAYAIGGPGLAVRTVNQFLHVKINHVIIVNLAAFVPFINALGGVNVKTGRVCANISGGTKNGGFTLNLRPGVHHFSGIQALVYARIRENPCNPADNDLTRVKHQQEILNAIRSRLLSPSTFVRLPIASWDAPKVLQTDMGGLTLLSLFVASEIGGNTPVRVLKPTGAAPAGFGSAFYASPADRNSARRYLLNG